MKERRIRPLEGEIEESQQSNVIRLKEVVIHVPRRIERVMMGINEKFEDVEFSIFCVTKFNEEKHRYEIDGNDIFIPKQEVSSHHIDYKEDNLKYNTVIHKHPDKCVMFSKIDEDYINTNFRFSLLWVDNEFKLAIGNFRIDRGVFVELPLKIIMGNMDNLIFPEEALVKIQPDTSRHSVMIEGFDPYDIRLDMYGHSMSSKKGQRWTF